jgi:hypothetical protein
MGRVSGQGHVDDPADAHEWRRMVESLWDSVARLRESHDTERRRRGQPPVTNKEIAEKIGVSDRTLGDWLRKRTVVPDWYVIGKLVKYLGGEPDAWKAQWERAKAAYDSRPRGRATGPDPADPQDEPAGQPRSAGPDGDQGDDRDATSGNGRRRGWGGKRGLLGAAVTVVVAAVATVVVVVTMQSRASQPPPQSTPSVRVWHATVINTWSSTRSADVGVYRYRSPVRPERLLPGLFTGDSVSIVCQYRQGREITDNATSRTSRVWNKLVDDSWIPDLFTDLPKVSGDAPPLGMPVCTDVS